MTDPDDPAVNDHGLVLWETTGMGEPIFLAMDGGSLQGACALLSLAGFEPDQCLGIRTVSAHNARNWTYSGRSLWSWFKDVSDEGIVCPHLGDLSPGAATSPKATVEELNGRILNIHRRLQELQDRQDEPGYLLRLRIIDELVKLEEERFRLLFRRQPGA
jgi:hypothetical protein